MQVTSIRQRSGLVMVGKRINSVEKAVKPVQPISKVNDTFDRNLYYQVFQSKKGDSQMNKVEEKKLSPASDYVKGKSILGKFLYIMFGIDRRNEITTEDPELVFDPLPRAEFKALSKEIRRFTHV